MGTTSDSGRGSVENTLQHFGVKGMRWGVRKTPSYKNDGEWAKDILKNRKLQTALAGDAVAKFNASKEFAAIRDNPKYTRAAMKDRAVQLEVGMKATPLLHSHLQQTLKDTGVQYSPSKRFEVQTDLTLESRGQSLANPHIRFLVSQKGKPLPPQEVMRLTAAADLPQYEVKVAHSAVVPAFAEFTLNYEFDSTGKLSGLSLAKNDLTQSGFSSVENTLQHFGVKGMRWGVRRDRDSSGGSAVTVTTKKGKGVVKVSGGGGKQVSEDAVTRYAVSQKGKKSTTAALSNEELRKHNERAKLESEFAKYNSEQTQKGQSLVKKIMKNERESILLNGRPGPIVSTGLMLATALTIKAVSGGSPVEALAKARGGAKLFEEAAKKSGAGKIATDTTKNVAKAATIATATKAGQASVSTILKSPPVMPKSYASQLSIAPGSTSKLGLGNVPKSIGSMSMTALQLKHPK